MKAFVFVLALVASYITGVYTADLVKPGRPSLATETCTDAEVRAELRSLKRSFGEWMDHEDRMEHVRLSGC